MKDVKDRLKKKHTGTGKDVRKPNRHIGDKIKRSAEDKMDFKDKAGKLISSLKDKDGKVKDKFRKVMSSRKDKAGKRMSKGTDKKINSGNR
jgi:hypothetical protein